MSETEGRSLHALGRRLHQQGRLDDAVASYRQALKLFPTLAQALDDLGAALLQLGRLEEATEVLTAACERDPQSATSHCNLGSALQRQGQLEEAVALLSRAVSLDPKLVNAQFNLGNALADGGDWSGAVSAYRAALALEPHHQPGLFNLGHALHQQGHLDEAVDAYRQAVADGPGDPRALSNLGTVLKELNRASEAEACYRRALALRPGDPTLEQNLRVALSRQLPAWHFPMLADEGRNDAYQRAIEKVVGRSSRVLDIGTGSGLLAMLAARAGAASVTACEVSPVVADAARQVVADNGFQDTISVVNKKSTALAVGVDLDQPANVVVSEIVDVGLLGEGVIPALRHARRHLLTADAAFIPRHATVFAQLIELPRLGRVNPLRTISGFDLSAFDRFRIPRDYLDVRLDQESYRPLSEVLRVATFDFRDPPPPTPDDAPRGTRHDVVGTDDGMAHAVAFWFELALDDDIVITTAPGVGSTAWGQAVQFLEEGLVVTKNARAPVVVSISDTRIEFRSAAAPIK